MYMSRTLEDKIRILRSYFPVVSLTGPRQSGKSTLLREIFRDYVYVNLETPQVRKEAQDDPVTFIKNRGRKLIIDEAQYVPELFSVVQTVVDQNPEETGQIILSGSQNFLLLKQIKQSLAGRVGIAKLLPFSPKELKSYYGNDFDELDFIAKGGYPRLYAHEIPARIYYQNYINTYVERDVSDLLDVRNLVQFKKFLKICALNAGNLINYTGIANDLDMSFATIKSWSFILQSSYIAFQLMPYSTNARKRLSKTPKLYFYDTGLLCHLLGIHSKDELVKSKYFGKIYENYVICETLKKHFNNLEEPEMLYYRDDSKREIDLLDCTHGDLLGAEIKSSATYHNSYARHINSIGDEIGIAKSNRFVVCRVDYKYNSQGTFVCPASFWLDF